MARKIEVVDYNSEWPAFFRREAKAIENILGKNCTVVHHIGSTAVKGLKAKPIIDIMPVVKDIALVDAHDAEFEALGYECKGEFGIPGRRFYTKGGDNRTHHVHIFEESNKIDVFRHVAVRDYLRAHKETAEKYAELKTRLAAEFTYDNDGYCDGKEKFMKELEKKALTWRKQHLRQALGMSGGLSVGAALGTIFGSVFGNTGVGICFGVSIGMSLGLALGAIKNK